MHCAESKKEKVVDVDDVFWKNHARLLNWILELDENTEECQDVLDGPWDDRNVIADSAKYRKNCLRTLELLSGRIRAFEIEETTAVMDYLYNDLESHKDECLFSLEELFNSYDGEIDKLKKNNDKYKNLNISYIFVRSTFNHIISLKYLHKT